MSDGSTIALVSCVGQKLDRPAPAGELYTSSLFTKSRRYAEEHADRWFILSALYGLLEPDRVIEPYEKTLKTMRRADCRVWAARVHGQMREAGLLVPGTAFLWLAGSAYQRDLADLLGDFEQRDPMVGLKIGERLAFLSGKSSVVERPASRAPRRANENKRMGKYDPLRAHLRVDGSPRITLTFAKIEAILGADLPRSARDHQAWWANGSHAHADSWLDAGYEVDSFDQSRGVVTFRKK